MNVSIRIYAKRKGIDLNKPFTDRILSTTLQQAADTQGGYQETLIATTNLEAYFSANRNLLTDPERLITGLFPSSRINELNETMKGIMPSLNVLKNRLLEI